MPAYCLDCGTYVETGNRCPHHHTQAEQRRANDDVPCLVVTGDLAAARARLAPVAHIDSGYVSALDLLADALLAIIDLDGCRGDCGDQTGACVPARIRTYLGWETTHE